MQALFQGLLALQILRQRRKYPKIFTQTFQHIPTNIATNLVRRKPLSSVDPAAQERAIALACEAAGVLSSELSAVELHGTGTPLGDPVEVSALSRMWGDEAACDGMGWMVWIVLTTRQENKGSCDFKYLI